MEKPEGGRLAFLYFSMIRYLDSPTPRAVVELKYLQTMKRAAPSDSAHPIACNPAAIGAAKRPAYRDLFQRLRAAVRERRELADGHSFRLDGMAISLIDTARWVEWERLCCPFLMFELQLTGDERDHWLTLRGPAGTNQLIDEEFA